jgi:hypothetical protein
MDIMFERFCRWTKLILITLSIVAFGSINVHADTLQSANYKLDEPVVGVGSIGIGSSTNYQALNSTGDIAIGNSASGSYQIEAGHTTTSDPALSFNISSGNINFGEFTASNATITTATFSVINYTSYGYIVQIIGNPPAYGSHVIPAMTSTDSSHSGTEQFGINIVANTSPFSFGANPDNGQFGFGSAAPNYDTPNSFRFVSGEIIAQAAKSSGATTYTISYLVNVNGLTPGGQYTGDQTLIITGTY